MKQEPKPAINEPKIIAEIETQEEKTEHAGEQVDELNNTMDSGNESK